MSCTRSCDPTQTQETARGSTTAVRTATPGGTRARSQRLPGKRVAHNQRARTPNPKAPPVPTTTWVMPGGLDTTVPLTSGAVLSYTWWCPANTRSTPYLRWSHVPPSSHTVSRPHSFSRTHMRNSGSRMTCTGDPTFTFDSSKLSVQYIGLWEVTTIHGTAARLRAAAARSASCAEIVHTHQETRHLSKLIATLNS